MQFKGSGIGISLFSGKIGSTVATGNKAGSFLRLRAHPADKNSISQSAQRAFFANAVKSWKSLTPAQQQSYIAGAKTVVTQGRPGNAFTLPGWAWFVQNSINSYIANQPQPTNWVEPYYQETPTGVLITSGGGQLIISWLNGPVSPFTIFAVYATPGLSDTTAYFNKKYRRIGLIPTGTASPVNITSMFTDKYGYFPLGNIISCKIKAKIFPPGYSGTSNNSVCQLL